MGYPEMFDVMRPFCKRCLELRNEKNFCPICDGCYEDDDFDSKMIECGQCKEWVHAQCEGLSDDWYQILSFLPDTVEFICKLCLKEETSLWKNAIKKDLLDGLSYVIDKLISIKSSKYLACTEKPAIESRTIASIDIPRDDAVRPSQHLNSENKELVQGNYSQPVQDHGNVDSEANAAVHENQSTSNLAVMDKIDSATEEGIASLHCCDFSEDAVIPVFEMNSKSRSENINEIGTKNLDTCMESSSSSSHCLDTTEGTKESASSLLNVGTCEKVIEDLSALRSSEEESENGKLCELRCSENAPAKEHSITDSPCKSEQIAKPNSHPSAEHLISPAKCDSFESNSKEIGYESDLEDEPSLTDKNSHYSLVAKVSKDIDDDCRSSEDSLYDGSDTEIESIIDDMEDPKGLLDIKQRVEEERYKSILQFHIDIMRVFETLKKLNKVLVQEIKISYEKIIREKFCWFNPDDANVFSLVDALHPFYLPYSDHNYPDVSHAIQKKSFDYISLPNSALQCSPYKDSCCLKKDALSPSKWNFSPRSESLSPTKCYKSPNSGIGSLKKYSKLERKFLDIRRCVLCNELGDGTPYEEGRLLYLGQDEWLHVNCGLWSSEVYEEDDGGLQNVYVAVSRGRQIRCSFCNERGATIGCCHKFCQATYHFKCAWKSGCFFREDKKVFCSNHLPKTDSDQHVNEMKVSRCVFVNMDSEKRKWKQTSKADVKIIIGSLVIQDLGDITPDVDVEDVLVTNNFSCSRMYWSTKDPSKRVRYSCRTRKITAVENTDVCDNFHMTIDHSQPQSLVQDQLEKVVEWHAKIKEHELAKQSIATNIIPPYMCPLYRDILRLEFAPQMANISSRTFLPTRRQLIFPSLPQIDESAKLSSCIDAQKNHSPSRELTSEAPSHYDPQAEENSCSLASCEANEIMQNIVNAEDNEIISMVLRDLTNSSTSSETSTISGRTSPLDMGILSNPSFLCHEENISDAQNFPHSNRPEDNDEVIPENHCSSLQQNVTNSCELNAQNDHVENLQSSLASLCSFAPQSDENHLPISNSINSILDNLQSSLCNEQLFQSYESGLSNHSSSIYPGSSFMFQNEDTNFAEDFQTKLASNNVFPIDSDLLNNEARNSDYGNQTYTQSNFEQGNFSLIEEQSPFHVNTVNEMPAFSGVSAELQSDINNVVAHKNDTNELSHSHIERNNFEHSFSEDPSNKDETNLTLENFADNVKFNATVNEFGTNAVNSSENESLIQHALENTSESYNTPSFNEIAQEKISSRVFENDYSVSEANNSLSETLPPDLENDNSQKLSSCPDVNLENNVSSAASNNESSSCTFDAPYKIPLLSEHASSENELICNVNTNNKIDVSTTSKTQSSMNASDINFISSNDAHIQEESIKNSCENRSSSAGNSSDCGISQVTSQSVNTLNREEVSNNVLNEVITKHTTKNDTLVDEINEISSLFSPIVKEQKSFDATLIQDIDTSLKMNELRVHLRPLSQNVISSYMKEKSSLPSNEIKSTVSSSNNSKAKKKVCRVQPIISSNENKKSSSFQGHTEVVSSLPSSASSQSLSDKNDSEQCSSKQKPAQVSTPKKKRIQMKRNYKTVIKKYPLRSAIRKNTPFETVQIEINETIELPSDDESCRESLKRKWCSNVLESESISDASNDYKRQSKRRKTELNHKDGNESAIDEVAGVNVQEDGHNQGLSPRTMRTTRSCQVVKFSDHHSDITVSIVNNNLRNYPLRRRRLRFKRNDLPQVDGAADGSSSETSTFTDSNENDKLSPMVHNLINAAMQPSSADLAMKIKQQSLARSAPGKEGPYKCAMCKRLYRTKESYSRHVETCDFEVESSSTEEETENDSMSLIPQKQSEQSKTDQELKRDGEECENKELSTSSFISKDSEENQNDSQICSDLPASSSYSQENASSAASSVQELLKTCSENETSLSKSSLSVSQVDEANSKTLILHRQVRVAMRRSPETSESADDSLAKGDVPSNNDSSGISEVFVPPSVSPMKFVPVVRKSESPRKYTNVRLFKGKQGYQYRRSAPQHNVQQQQIAVLQNPQNIQQIHQNIVQIPSQTVIPTPTIVNPANPFAIQTTPFPTTHYQIPSSAQWANTVRTDIPPLSQVLTVVSGSSVALPTGFTLQYVGSYRDSDINTSPSLMPYQPPHSVVIPQPLLMTPDPPPVVVPQVVNSNITYRIGNQESVLVNQHPSFLPDIQYISQAPQQPLYQTIENVMAISQRSVQPVVQPLPQDTSSTTSLRSQTIEKEVKTSTNGEALFSSLPSVTVNKDSVCINASSNKNRPQAHIAPISKGGLNEYRKVKIGSSPPSYPRPLFPQITPISRSVATVAPAIFSSTSSAALNTLHKNSNSMSRAIQSTEVFSSQPSLTKGSTKPRPTYSYRDAMKICQSESNIVKRDTDEPVNEKGDVKTTDDSDSEKESFEKETNERKSDDSDSQTQSYKLILKKDKTSGNKFNIQPLSVPNTPLPTPEVKELRIKAKVSVGPKRKKPSLLAPEHQLEQCGKEFFLANKDTMNDPFVNELYPNMSLNFSPTNASLNDDSRLIEKSKVGGPTEPRIVFELTSEDGFKVEAHHVSEVWQKVFDAVTEARENLCHGFNRESLPSVPPSGPPNTKEKTLSGLEMLGLTHNAVQYLLEQLPGAKDCHKYSFQFHRRPKDESLVECPSGCARSEPFKNRSPYDVFSWLASKHRRLPLKARANTDEIQFSSRRATSMELPMAMRYRHLSETAREAVGVFRSGIHGRGLFCKREIDAGEMVIEYAGQMIRSCLCDMREKLYESKGIGCYMFRIDEETVIDATMHGNAARFINHSCDPNCYSRIVDILGKKHIIIFALRRITRGEELTYDYKFPIEDDKIPCSCGAKRCRKYLN